MECDQEGSSTTIAAIALTPTLFRLLALDPAPHLALTEPDLTTHLDQLAAQVYSALQAGAGLDSGPHLDRAVALFCRNWAGFDISLDEDKDAEEEGQEGVGRARILKSFVQTVRTRGHFFSSDAKRHQAEITTAAAASQDAADVDLDGGPTAVDADSHDPILVDAEPPTDIAVAQPGGDIDMLAEKKVDAVNAGGDDPSAVLPVDDFLTGYQYLSLMRWFARAASEIDLVDMSKAPERTERTLELLTASRELPSCTYALVSSWIATRMAHGQLDLVAEAVAEKISSRSQREQDILDQLRAHPGCVKALDDLFVQRVRLVRATQEAAALEAQCVALGLPLGDMDDDGDAALQDIPPDRKSPVAEQSSFLC
ncbi:hypothetical protein JCM9279_000367 [Rhodotorula babjevae]